MEAMYKKIIWLILTAAWCLFIFFQSGKPAMESSRQSLFITDLLNRMEIIVPSESKLLVTETVIRKTAHFLEYFVLGILFFNCIYARKLRSTFLYSMLAGVLYAELDEIHQYFVPGRAMLLTDVGIDSAGVLAGILLMAILVKRRSGVNAQQL